MALDRRFTLLLDYRLASEYREVLLRLAHVSNSHLTRGEILALLNDLEAVSEAVDIDVRHRPLSTDPNDDRVLDLAINGKADVIVTRNLRHIARPAAAFRIATMEPDIFLFTIRQ